MILKITCTILLLAITWVWLNRGFFNSLFHMLCTLVAGAIAFAFWEPLAYLLLDVSPDSGFLSFVGYVAWGAALLVPFGVSLILLRFLTDKLIPSKVATIGVVEYLGGGVCGAVSAAISVGVLFIGFGFLPGTGSVRPVDYSETSIGSLERAGGLWIPAERFTAGLYGQLSLTTLRTGEPLAEWYPDLDVAGYAINISGSNGKARPSMPFDAVSVKKTYFIGDDAGTSRVNDLLITGTDQNAINQKFVGLDGEPISTGRLYGVVVEFNESAKEMNGQVVLGNGQTRLVMRDASGTMAVHPVALISQARSSDAELYGRFPYDSEDLFIASVGGSSNVTMGFEFVVPQGYTPEALVVKNTRVMLDGEADQRFGSAGARFSALSSGGLVGGSSVTDLDTSDSQRVEPNTNPNSPAGLPGFAASDRIGYSFEVRQKGSLEIDENNAVTRGTMKFRPDELGVRGVDRKVIVEKFASSPDVQLVRVDVGRESAASLLGRAAKTVERVLPPQLIDTNGQAYPAVGYVYADREIVEISFDPANSIRGLSQLPTLSSSRSDQKMTLIFRVSKGVDIEYFAVGQKVLTELDPPMTMD
jgi:hypothetical protein